MKHFNINIQQGTRKLIDLNRSGQQLSLTTTGIWESRGMNEEAVDFFFIELDAAY